MGLAHGPKVEQHFRLDRIDEEPHPCARLKRSCPEGIGGEFFGELSLWVTHTTRAPGHPVCRGVDRRPIPWPAIVNFDDIACGENAVLRSPTSPPGRERWHEPKQDQEASK